MGQSLFAFFAARENVDVDYALGIHTPAPNNFFKQIPHRGVGHLPALR